MLTLRDHKNALAKLETIAEVKEYVESNNEFNSYSPKIKRELLSFSNMLSKEKKKKISKKKIPPGQKTIFLTD